jgi:hypothetical protein
MSAAVTGALSGTRRLLPVLVLFVALATTVNVASAHAEDVVRWRSEPAEAPPPPEGVEKAPYPVSVGTVGEISFWEPNRGLLITGGGGPVSGGLYAYDGKSWHQLSIVCGGAEGRIAWASRDEFWTISDQRPGQGLAEGSSYGRQLQSLSLCHFANGQVVGSYAMPLEEPDSYQKMDAAACYGPSDCWFGGPGGFHLHWNGSTVTEVQEPEHHAVVAMATFGGQLFESVQIDEGDEYLPYESTKRPALIHEIAPEGQMFACGEVENPFCDMPIPGKLPEYGKGVKPYALQGFDLATDGSELGGDATQLWAAANPQRYISPPASLTVLREDEAGQWSQVVPNKNGESSLAGMRLGGSTTWIGSDLEYGVRDAIAPEPGSTSAWISLNNDDEHIELVRLNADGELSEPSTVLSLPEAGEKIGYRGEAGPIVCPAAHDCWLATLGGWLYHYSNGEQITPDTDPFFDGEDGVITYRPPDSGVPVIPPDQPPEDDSLINQQTETVTQGTPQTTSTAGPGVKTSRVSTKPLLKHVKSKFVHGRTLVITFTLTARAHVRLLGRRKGRVVASTPMKSLRPGRHELSLRLNPDAWPTSIQFHATPIGVPSAPPEPEPESSGAAGSPEAG